MKYKHSYKYPQKTLSALSVCNTGVHRCEGGYSWGPGVRDHYLIHYVISGRGCYQTGERTYQLFAGDLFLAMPDQNIYYCADDDEPWEYCWVGFHGAEARILLEETDLSESTPVLSGVSEDVYKQMMRIYESRGTLVHQTAFMTGALYQLIGILIRDRVHTEGRRGGAYVRHACEYISNNYAMSISVSDVADHVGLSRSRLYRLFTAELGLSPVEYLTQFRIRQACVLLRRGDLSVKEVAASVGYENQLYFSRRFHEIMGVPPSKWAESQRLKRNSDGDGA